MKTVRNAYANCTAKDPANCPYHKKQFEQVTVFKNIHDLFKAFDERVPASSVIPYLEPNFEEYLKEGEATREKLPEEQRSALYNYSDDYGSQRITYLLHNPERDFVDTPAAISWKQIGHIDNYIKDNTPPREEAQVLYRGLKNPSRDFDVKGLKPGRKIKFKNFLSTSLSTDVAKDFTNAEHPVVLRIETKEGAVLYNNFMEYEYLLPRDLPLEVTKVEENITLQGRRKDLDGVTLITLMDPRS